MGTWILTSVVIAVSAAVQGVTGFGFAVLAVPLLLVLYDPREAVVLTVLLSTVGVAAMWWRTRREIRRGMAVPLMIGAVVGLPLGLLVLLWLDPALLKAGAGLVTVILGIGLLTDTFRQRGRRPTDGTGEASGGVWSRITAGAVSGFLAGSLGMAGPPLMVLLHHEGVRKRAYRATSFAYFALIYPTMAIALLASGLVTPAMLVSSMTHLPALVVGTLLGDVGHDMVTQQRFTLGVLGLLVAAGMLSAGSGVLRLLNVHVLP